MAQRTTENYIPENIVDQLCDVTLSTLRLNCKNGNVPQPFILKVLRHKVMRIDSGDGTSMKRLLRKNLRDPLPNYKKRAFEQVLEKLEATNLISKQIQTDVINGQKKILISLPKADKEQEKKISDSDVTILLFYAYCPQPMTRAEQDKAIAFCHQKLSALGVTGRLRIGREGFNSTLTGSYSSIRAFTQSLKELNPPTFEDTDFKYVDGLPANQMLKGLKVWPVTEIVTYGFDPADAPLNKRGTHLSPEEFHRAMMNDNSIMIDVRNFNETLIGKFNPPKSTATSHAGQGDASEAGQGDTYFTFSDKVLDPCMRKSTEFPEWVEKNKEVLKGKQVLMYCTGGVRCERASAYLRHRAGIDNVYQLEGGIHRYLEAFKEDGGFFVGKNYTFDKRFSHGAESNVRTISSCVHCGGAWDRYQAQKTCANKACGMEILLCKSCQRMKPPIPSHKLFCPLCSSNHNNSHSTVLSIPKKRKMEDVTSDDS